MNRLHLFEIEDQKWFPAFLRNYTTDFLQFLSNKTKMYRPIVSVLSDIIEKTGEKQIVDLGSGGGGGLLWLNSELKKTFPDLKIILTDYYPNIPAFEETKKKSGNFEYVAEQVDARNGPHKLKGIRTQFLSFHHFKKEDAKAILQDAVDSGCAIAIFEAQERSFLSILAMIFSPVTVLLTTPFIKPFEIGRIIFTYLIPIVPLVVFWDGIVSALRTYSVEEMTDLVMHLHNPQHYHWDIKRIKSGPGVILYLTGIPK